MAAMVQGAMILRQLNQSAVQNHICIFALFDLLMAWVVYLSEIINIII
jgi:predicted transcriptional regulator with HTH domain